MLFLTYFALLNYNANIKIQKIQEIKKDNNCSKIIQLKSYFWLKNKPFICKTNDKIKKTNENNINEKKYNLKNNVIKTNDPKDYKTILKDIEIISLLKNIKDYKIKWTKIKEELSWLNNQKFLTKIANNNYSDFTYFMDLFKFFNSWIPNNPYLIVILKKTILVNWKLKFLTQKIQNKKLQKIQNMMLNDFLKIMKTKDKNSNIISQKDFNILIKNSKKWKIQQHKTIKK